MSEGYVMVPDLGLSGHLLPTTFSAKSVVVANSLSYVLCCSLGISVACSTLPTEYLHQALQK